MTTAEWKDIASAPAGNQFEHPPMVLLKNDKAGWVGVGWAEWKDGVPRPIWNNVDATGIGRCNPTHWAEMPQ